MAPSSRDTSLSKFWLAFLCPQYLKYQSNTPSGLISISLYSTKTLNPNPSHSSIFYHLFETPHNR